MSDSTPAEVADLVERAAAAAPVLAATAPAERRAWLDAVARALEEQLEPLAALADDETLLGLPRCRAELGRAAAQLRFYAEVAVEGSYLGVALDTAGPAGPALARVNRPLGPVAVFGASNFPFAFGLLGNDTASALAAGCPVVAKAHPAHARLSERLAALAIDALRAAGAPDGAFGVVRGLQAGRDLVAAPGVRAVGFTGSQAGGLALWRLANERAVVIPVYAEMGTVNPVVMTPAAAARAADVAAGLVGSFTLGAGQFCTKPGLLLAPAGSGMAQAVAAALETAAPAPRMLTEQIADGVGSGVDALVAAGAQVVGSAAGAADAGEPTTRSAPAVVLSAPVEALRPGSALLEEVFGAVAVVVEYADDAQLGAALDALQGSLVATVATDGTGDDPQAPALVARLAERAGRVTVDDWPTGVAWTWAQQHGGPWPATSAPSSTSVGAAALERWVRPVAYQSAPEAALPPAARAENPWSVPRRVDGRLVTP